MISISCKFTLDAIADFSVYAHLRGCVRRVEFRPPRRLRPRTSSNAGNDAAVANRTQVGFQCMDRHWKPGLDSQSCREFLRRGFHRRAAVGGFFLRPGNFEGLRGWDRG